MNNLSGDFKTIGEALIPENKRPIVRGKEEIEKPKISDAKFKKEVEKILKAAIELQASIDSLYALKTVPELYGTSIYVGLSIKELKTLN